MSYTVTLKPSNTSYSCEAEENLLEGALRNDIKVPFGCQRGSCGSCIGQIVEGEFFYQEPSEIEQLGEKDVFMCQAHPKSDLILKINIEENIPVSKILPVKIIDKNQLTHDIVQLILKLPIGEKLDFHAGQYIDFLLKDGKRRSFSLANPPNEENTLELHIRHIEGGHFTDIVFNQIKQNEIMRIEGPLGSFYLRTENQRPIIMMGGGTGFAPLKGMIEEAIQQNHDLDIHLFWGVRAKRDLYMLDEIESWKEKLKNFKFTPVLSEAQQQDQWQGETGFVHQSVMSHYPQADEYDFYMCGPPVMINAARDALLQAGVSTENMYSDSFDFQK